MKAQNTEMSRAVEAHHSEMSTAMKAKSSEISEAQNNALRKELKESSTLDLPTVWVRPSRKRRCLRPRVVRG